MTNPTHRRGLRRLAGRGLAALAAAGVMATTLVSIPAEPAAAARQKQMVVRFGEPAIAEFPPIPANYPRPFTVDDGILDPAQCATPPTSNVCDTVPVKIIPPSLGPFDDWFVRATLSWAPQGGLLELDLYFWDNLQILNDGSTYTRISRSQTAGNPEKLEVIRPDLGDYNFTVSNWNGTNRGYKLKVEILKGDPFDAPFESTEPPADFSSTPDFPVTDFSSGSFDFALPDFGEAFAGLDPIELAADGSFGSSFQVGALPRPATNFANAAVNLPPPGPASGLLMVIWLVLLPLAIAAGVAGYLFRRTSATEWSFT